MFVGRMSDVAKQQAVLPAAIVRGIEAMQSLDPLNKAPGRYALEGDQLYCLIQDIELRTLGESRPEAHRNFIDVQIPLSTSERFGFSLPQADLALLEDCFEARDVAFYATPANESFIDIEPGSFIVFLPNELHRPCLAIDGKKMIRKAVLKVHASLLGG